MTNDELIIKFKGGLAEEHKLPAYAAAQALTGLTRSILIPLAYLAEGKVRHRKIEHEGYQLNLITLREGSVDTILQLITDPDALALLVNVLGDGAKDAAKEFVKDFFLSIIRRCVGKSATKEVEALEEEEKLPSGDMEALVEAIEPAMRDAHRTIGNGTTQIIIISGDRNVVTLNSATKAYVMESIEDTNIREKEFSIASFNANTGYGRAFDYDIGRTVPFVLDRSIDATTITAISNSLRKYAYTRRLGDRHSSRALIQYSTWVAPDERVKKMLVYRVREAS